MRSGLILESACRWYNDVACMMADLSESGAIALRLKDVVTRPTETCDELYRSLGVRWSEDGKFEFKVKLYGADCISELTEAAAARFGYSASGVLSSVT
jgi:hypothetical protein